MRIDETDVEWQDIGPDDTGFRRRQLGAAAGSEDIGCSLYELPAGERAWPYHYHTSNEEALYVLAGTGTLRVNDEERDLAPGTYVAFPTGEESAHRVVNDAEELLRYLVISTMDEPDVVGYPDADALGVYAGTPPGGDENERVLSGFFREDDRLDFWEDVAGEE
ncbi:cupin domain-containing protein [Halococcus sediminicola]|uniref:cupin domain-containing protein n=1 Tax=Halococcus sediminicola TaxID=1264579 RepID=UPI0006790278|nr:cupin domain-containing protein [Halococcus sediminicola]